MFRLMGPQTRCMVVLSFIHDLLMFPDQKLPGEISVTLAS